MEAQKKLELKTEMTAGHHLVVIYDLRWFKPGESFMITFINEDKQTHQQIYCLDGANMQKKLDRLMVSINVDNRDRKVMASEVIHKKLWIVIKEIFEVSESTGASLIGKFVFKTSHEEEEPKYSIDADLVEYRDEEKTEPVIGAPAF